MDTNDVDSPNQLEIGKTTFKDHLHYDCPSSGNFQYPHEVILKQEVTAALQVKKEPKQEFQNEDVFLNERHNQCNLENSEDQVMVNSDPKVVPECDKNDPDYEADFNESDENDDTWDECTPYGKRKDDRKKDFNFQCEHCDKRFARRFRLKDHALVHSGIKPYECKYCSKKFSRSGGLVAHERTHTGERPYGCQYCDKKFADYSTLTAHRRTHTGERPYKCEECGKGFNNPGHLQRHKRIHSGEKPFQCKDCDKSFNQQTSLKTHMRIHSGVRPYVCNICGTTFSHSSHVNRHKRRFHELK